MRLNYSPGDELGRSHRLFIDSVDCRVCGAVFVPHLVWPDSPPEKAGLCDEHYRALVDERLGMKRPEGGTA